MRAAVAPGRKADFYRADEAKGTKGKTAKAGTEGKQDRNPTEGSKELDRRRGGGLLWDLNCVPQDVTESGSAN